MGPIFLSEDERHAVLMHTSQQDALAEAVAHAKSRESARTAIHKWRMANWQLFRQIADSWRSRKLLERITRSRGIAAYAGY